MRTADGDHGLVLVINCGSSSIKYQLLRMPQGEFVAGGVVERIGETAPVIKHRDLSSAGASEAPHIAEIDAADHREAFHHIDMALRASPGFEGGEGLVAIGHRVVHGGESFSAPTLITPTVIGSIRALSSLAPLHNPPNLVGIRVCRERFPTLPQVAVFDTAFHQTMPPHAYRYAIPEDWYERDGIRRYGFHGSSHQYVAEQAAVYLGRPIEDLHLITLHLGNGDLDPAIALYMQKVRELRPEDIDRLLNRESGLRGLCGSNDMRDLLARSEAGDEDARLAIDLYCYRVKKYIGAYAAALGSLDAVVFTGGVGENAPAIRLQICEGLDILGLGLDVQRNDAVSGSAFEIGRSELTVKVLVVRTNEELQIAREAMRVVAPSAS